MSRTLTGNPISLLMKQFLLFTFCGFLLSPIACLSQEIETKIKYVWGYSEELPDVSLGIAIGKTSVASDEYFIRFRLDISANEYRNIYLSRESAITFLHEDGNSIELNLEGMKASINRYRQIEDPKIMLTLDNFITELTVPVSREELTEIGSEPFYKIVLPYINGSSNEKEIIFVKPALFNNRKFLQSGVNEVLKI